MIIDAAELWAAVRTRAAGSAGRVEALTASRPPAPRVGQAEAAENLLEAMLLARAAVGLGAASTVQWPADGERLGHHVGEDGSIRPVLAERLEARGETDATWPDQLVRDVIAEPKRYAERLLGSPFRVIARKPERIMELGASAPDADLSWARVRGGVLTDLPWPGRWRPGVDLLGLAAAAEQSPDREADLLPLLDTNSRPAAVRHALDFETTCLRHAARIAAPHLDREPTAEELALVWRLGQQLRRVLMESPFLGADAELLNARLQPLLPRPDAEPGASAPADAWWPERFATVDLGEALALTALARRVRRPELSARVAAAVQTVAARVCTPPERVREEAADALAVGPPHGAPPMLARWLLHRSGIPWLGVLPDDAREETFALLRNGWGRPGRVRWILWGIERELRAGAKPQTFAELADWLPGAIACATGEDCVPALIVAAALVGAGLLAPDTKNRTAWLTAAAAAPEWELGILRTFAERAPSLRAAALDVLRACSLREPARANAAATALLSLARSGAFDADGMRAWWAAAPAAVRGDPRLARDYTELDQRDRASSAGG